MNLLWQLKEVLRDLPVRRILDVGTGMRVSRNICLPESAEKALLIDPDRQALSACIDYYDNDRVEALEGKIENADYEEASFDTVLFILSLPWIDDPPAALQKAASHSPLYIIISNPEFSPEQLGKIPSYFPEHESEITGILGKYNALSPDLDAILQACDYYPLLVFKSNSWSPTPEHSLRTVLYTREKPDRIPYNQAAYIIQVNGKCTNNCPSCYVIKNDETMETAIFNDLIKNMHENEMICLRGGEPPLSENLIEDFIQPALDKGIYVILESNGSFIGSTRYREYLAILTHKNIEVRLSLDREHFDFFPERIRRARIGWVSTFIEDATKRGIKFALFTLGMCREQVKKFLDEYSVKSWLHYIRPLTKYSNISDLPIQGKYVDIKGTIHASMS
jgi:SAM-dependent methyltransferase